MTMKNISPFVLRVGLGLVVVWFGVEQISNPSSWVGFLPGWTAVLPVGKMALIYLNGWFEIVFGLALIAGFYTRIMACLIALHLLEITYTVGYGAIGVRDFGLTVALVSIFLNGSDFYSVDRIFQLREQNVPVANSNQQNMA